MPETIQPVGYVYEWTPSLVAELVSDARAKAVNTQDEHYQSPDLIVRGGPDIERDLFDAVNDLPDEIAREEDLIAVGPDEQGRENMAYFNVEIGGDR